MLATLPQSRLVDLSIRMDREIARKNGQTPVGGRLSHFRENWKQVSSDPWILDTITGSRIEFRGVPQQTTAPGEIHLDAGKTQIMAEEVQKLEEKGAISAVQESEPGYTSSIFLVPKSDGSWRPVVNLKPLNQYVISRHFKMESLKTAKNIIQKGDWLVKLDLKDAYLTVPMHRDHWKFLRFRWKGRLWQFKVLPFGLSSAPYTFTKLMKPVISLLRKLGIRVILYLDDMLIMAESQEEAKRHLATALELLVCLGFVVNTRKSVFSPSQSLEFLGFLLDTQRMVISLPENKLRSLRKLCSQMARQEKTTLREIAQLLGMMVAAHPAILPAPLHFRCLERAKSQALRLGLQYEMEVRLTMEMKADLGWWQTKVARHNGRTLQITQWDLTIESDASMRGWGASCQGTTTGGPWTAGEKMNSINYLELLAAFLALQSFASNMESVRILLRIDNITAIAFLNRMGGAHSRLLSDLAVEVWNWCLRRDITIHAEHLPGRENIRADWESRHMMDSSNWMLHRGVFTQLEELLGPFSVDLFASRTNAQLPVYCSWRADPTAWAVDALSISWAGLYPYLFPPFTLIPACLDKISREEVSALMIAPVWPNQLWFPQLLRRLRGPPILLPHTQDIISDPEGRPHPLVMEGHLPLAAWPISGNHSVQKDYQRELLRSSGNRGGNLRSQHTQEPGICGIAGALDGALIHFQPL